MKIEQVFKEGVTQVVNPFIPGIAIGGSAHRVLNALDYVFIQEGKVFEGSVNDHIELARQAGVRESDIRRGFQDLNDEGWLTLHGDTFTPREWLIGRYG